MSRLTRLLPNLISVCILCFGIGCIGISHAEVSKYEKIRRCLDRLHAALQPVVQNRLSVFGWRHVYGDEFYSDEMLGTQKIVIRFERSEPNQVLTKLSLHFKLSTSNSTPVFEEALLKYVPNNLGWIQKRPGKELELEENVFKVVQEIKNSRERISCDLSDPQ